jgi:tRNA pseudouridine38-40 synthase
VNVAALVEYDGTRFAGFQRQAPDKGPTVQGAIEAAISRVVGTDVGIKAAGRTDSGVHATGQVVNFRVPERLDEAAWQRALNALLPGDVSIRATCRVADDFHARRSALSRSYRYMILCDTCRAPLRERFTWRVARQLDVAAMQAGAELLLGEHDFGSFGSSPQDQRTARGDRRGHTVRVMRAASCRWVPEEHGTIDMIECRFTANAFLAGMVRRLVGTLALVGAGRLGVAEFQRILAAGEKSHPGPAAPARGLCLTGVEYPGGAVVWESDCLARGARDVEFVVGDSRR